MSMFGWMIHSETHFVIKLGMVMQHHELECYAEKNVLYVQGQGHSKGLCDQNMSISNPSSKLLIPWQPNLA